MASAVQELVNKLEESTLLPKRGKANKRVYNILGSEKKVVSWRFNEWDYGKPKIQLPCNARGLFILENEPVIVARGYDKFFNVDEVPTTRWDYLKNNTKGPYTVTSKENGCIIFISGLEDGTIVVCSKHSTGERTDVNRNHATAGQKVLEEQLEKVNVTTKELALELYKLNVTAVAEFCDDSFEEHIIEYKDSNSGLYLHGLNENLPEFKTYSMDKVDELSMKYGFKQIEYEVKETQEELQEFLYRCSETGSYKGKETEGFVIRCKLTTDEDYFFKFKFEEPYLMYRQWREVTKEYINKKDRSEIKFSKHKLITNLYLDFVIPLIDKNPEISDNFLKGLGIIDLRNKFLEHHGLTGLQIIDQESLDHLALTESLKSLTIDETTKFVLIPVATIGCGKSTTGLTLTNLFRDTWGMISNDDIPKGKSAKKEFVKRGLELLKKKQVVILDRNNHQKREREQIFSDIKELKDSFLPHNTNIQFICLDFIENSSQDLFDITLNRVKNRGDNHQSIKVESDGEAFVRGIMKGFLNRFEPVIIEEKPDSDFNLVINLNVTKGDSSLENAAKTLEELQGKYPQIFKETPTNARFQEAFNEALSFKTTIRKFKGPTRSAKKQISPVYYALELKGTKQLIERVDSLIEKKSIKIQESNATWQVLKESNRVQNEFHVTLSHINQAKKGTENEKKQWKLLESLNLAKEAKTGNKVTTKLSGDIKLTKLIWDEKIAMVLVDILRIYNEETGEEVDVTSSNKFPHITLGTISEEIKPFLSNKLAENADEFNGEGYFEGNIFILKWDENDHDALIENASVVVNF